MGYRIDEIVALNLRRIRLEKNLTQGALAELAKISRQSVSNIEKAMGATSKTLERLADCLEVSPLAFYQDETADPEIRLKRVSPKVGWMDTKPYVTELESTVDHIIKDTKQHIYYISVMPAIKETFNANWYDLIAGIEAHNGEKVLHSLMDTLLTSTKEAIFNDSDSDDEMDDLMEGDDING